MAGLSAPRRRLQIRLPEDVAADLEQLARRQRRSVNNLVENVCAALVETAREHAASTEPQPPTPVLPGRLRVLSATGPTPIR